MQEGSCDLVGDDLRGPECHVLGTVDAVVHRAPSTGLGHEPRAREQPHEEEDVRVSQPLQDPDLLAPVELVESLVGSLLNVTYLASASSSNPDGQKATPADSYIHTLKRGTTENNVVVVCRGSCANCTTKNGALYIKWRLYKNDALYKSGAYIKMVPYI